MIDFDMSGINEEDDYLGDIALTYADYCAKVYRKLELSGLKYTIESDSAFMKKIFNPLTKIAL